MLRCMRRFIAFGAEAWSDYNRALITDIAWKAEI